MCACRGVNQGEPLEMEAEAEDEDSEEELEVQNHWTALCMLPHLPYDSLRMLQARFGELNSYCRFVRKYTVTLLLQSPVR